MNVDVACYFVHGPSHFTSYCIKIIIIEFGIFQSLCLFLFTALHVIWNHYEKKDKLKF